MQKITPENSKITAKIGEKSILLLLREFSRDGHLVLLEKAHHFLDGYTSVSAAGNAVALQKTRINPFLCGSRRHVAYSRNLTAR
jgi:hypothetical protein